MKLISAISLFAVLVAANVPAVASRPVELEGLSLQSPLLGKEVRYSAIVPQGAENERYPVLYLLHGIGGDCSSWLEYTDVAGMMERGEIPQMVVVMPDGYLSYYADAADGSLPYESMFLQELMPEVEKRFPVLANRDSRVIAGFSMGGFGALTLGLRNRNLFKYVIGLSPSMRTDSVYATEGPQDEWEKQWGRTFDGVGLKGRARITPYYRARAPYHIVDTLALKEFDNLHLTIDIGDRENSLAASSEQMHRRMAERGIRHIYRVREGGHDFDCWNPALREALNPLKATSGVEPSGSRPEVSVLSAGSMRVYLPYSAEGSSRRYPVVYLRGDFTDTQVRVLAARTDVLEQLGKIRPMALCFLADEDSIAGVEKIWPQLRDSRRMRALVEVGIDPTRLKADITDEPTYTAVVLYQTAPTEIDAAEFGGALRKHHRYPRLWIEQSPDNPGYAFGSDLHVALRKLGASHKYRVESPSGGFLPNWEEWLEFIDARFHI